jgi:hypothetical protein
MSWHVRFVPKADINTADGRPASTLAHCRAQQPLYSLEESPLPRIEALAAAAVMMLASSLFVGEADHAAFSQRIIQGVPNRSATMPKRSAKKVSPIGMRTVPPSAKVLKMRFASVAVSTPTVTEKPLG